MHMGRARVRQLIAGMAVGMKMHGAIAMAVTMEMHAVTPQPPQHMRAKADQHDADGGLDRLCHDFGNGAAEQDRDAGKDEQGQRVAEPPGQPMLDDVAHAATARGDAGDGRDMIGLKRMLHAQQEPETQNSQHYAPYPLLIASNTSWRHLSGQRSISRNGKMGRPRVVL